MKISQQKGSKQATTHHSLVVPFYVYAAVFLFISCLLLFLHAQAFQGHHFQPSILGITHAMALGWGSMIIFGAAHQLMPVLTEGKLYSSILAKSTFYLMAIGIPLLCYGFLTFQLGSIAITGALFVLVGVLTFIANLFLSVYASKKDSIHATFMLTAAIWLGITVLWGFLLLLNFTTNIFANNSLFYLASHAHAGIVGWFLILVLGVGSRLIPMFLLSKYKNDALLWVILALLNMALIMFIVAELKTWFLPLSNVAYTMVFVSVGLFIFFCLKAYHSRLKKSIDPQLKLALMAVMMILIPLAALLLMVSHFYSHQSLILLYGFAIFFGWITAIIFGMTFKTLPFIIWNKVYHIERKAEQGKSPAPNQLYSDLLFKNMQFSYLAGLLLFCIGLLIQNTIWLQTAALLLVGSSLLYLTNIIKIIRHKPITL